MRISLQLIDVPTQRHIWANSYNRGFEDVFSVQTDIAERTAEALRLELARGRGTGPTARPTPNLAAYDLYLRGLVAASELFEKEGFEVGIRCFEQAAALDPNFADAYAAWGNSYVLAAGDMIPMREAMPKARTLAARAIELDPSSSQAHSTLGNIAFQFDHDWVTSEVEFQKAIALNPSNVTAYRFYALMLFALGRFEEAKAMVRQAIRLNPIGHLQGMLSWIELEAGNIDEALRIAEELGNREPNSLGTQTFLGMYYLAAGRRADALRQADLPIENSTDSERFDHALLNALLARPEEARDVVAKAERGEAKSYTSGTHLAMMYAALGERSKALDLLEQGYREGDRVLWLWYRGIYFDSIRNDPRFVALLHEYGLPRGSGNPRPAAGTSAG